MIRYRILHIPSGEWVRSKTPMGNAGAPKSYMFKWFANYMLNRMLRDTTYLKNKTTRDSSSSLVPYVREEFCVVAVNESVYIGDDTPLPPRTPRVPPVKKAA